MEIGRFSSAGKPCRVSLDSWHDVYYEILGWHGWTRQRHLRNSWYRDFWFVARAGCAADHDSFFGAHICRRVFLYFLSAVFGGIAVFLQSWGKLIALGAMFLVMIVVAMAVVIIYRKKSVTPKK